MATWNIRPANERDAEALARCIDAAYAAYASRIADLPAVSDGISEDIENHLVWVAILNDQIAGGLVLIPKDDFAVLANIAVDPRYSGRGLGRALAEFAEEECLRLGKHELRLSTHVDLPENVQLYEHLGWQRTAQVGNKIHMRKAL